MNGCRAGKFNCCNPILQEKIYIAAGKDKFVREIDIIVGQENTLS
jgi:hypothetical protein